MRTPTEWDDPVAVERSRKAAQKRAESGKRRRVDPTTCDLDYSPAEVEFMNAMEAYKRRNGRKFPVWSEVLEVLESLGYVRDAAEAAAAAA